MRGTGHTLRLGNQEAVDSQKCPGGRREMQTPEEGG